MEFAIMAAGEGSRLIQEGIKIPKPLVPLNGKPIIGRLIDTFIKNGASKIHIVVNGHSKNVEDYLRQLRLPILLNVIKKTTPSSLHSFHAIIPHIQADSICLTTVDTIFNEQEFAEYLQAFKKEENLDGLMAATGFVDDECPLYIVTDSNLRITQYLDKKNDHCKLVSGGIYCFRRSVFKLAGKAIGEGISRMRNLQRLLIHEGLRINAYPFSKIIDIDHATDIIKAEEWLSAANAGVSQS